MTNSICNKTFEEWWKAEGIAMIPFLDNEDENLIKKACNVAWSNGGYKALETVENKSEYNGKNIHVVVCENDKIMHGVNYLLDDGGPIVMETYTNKASIEGANAFIERLNGRYGKTRIAKLVFIDEV